MTILSDKLAVLSTALTTYKTNLTNKLAAKVDDTDVGVTVAPLSSGTVPAVNLPSYVDDVLEFANQAAFPATGESGKIYVALNNVGVQGQDSQFRWTGSGYQAHSSSPGSTDNVPEGATNKYFTVARASAAAPVQTVNGKSGTVSLVAADISGISTVGKTGNYADLSGKPTIPTALSQMSNDAGFITSVIGSLGYTPVQQGGGTGQTNSKVYIGWRDFGGSAALSLQIDATDYGSTWPINVSGKAAELRSENNYQVSSLGVGTPPPGGNGIRAVGDIQGFYSDIRLKRVIGYVNNAINLVNQLEPIYYYGNELAGNYGFDTKELQVGLSAQSVQKVLPQVVKPAPFDIEKDEKTGVEKSKSGENYLTLQYERIVPLLVSNLKELNSLVSEQQKTIEELKDRIYSLEQRGIKY